jgi:hypothetical protein
MIERQENGGAAISGLEDNVKPFRLLSNSPAHTWHPVYHTGDPLLDVETRRHLTMATTTAVTVAASHPLPIGTYTGTTTITTPRLHHTVSDHAIQHMLKHEISTNDAFPQPTPNTLCFVYLPPGVAVVQGGARSCQVFCGYHSDIDGQVFYAVMPFPGCAGCAGGLATLDALTATSSHELCEAITDPIPGQGWYDDANGEIGDICAWQTKHIGPYTVQQEWSNTANACI